MNVTAMLVEPDQAHRRFLSLWREVRPLIEAGQRLVLKIRPETRSTAQNDRMWVLLDAVSKQVIWHGQALTSEEWKDVFTAALKRQKVVPGLEGGFVVLGSSTSRMTRSEHCDLQTLIEAFGAERGVEFGEPVAQAA